MTDLLDFARGPLLMASIAVFVFGVFWRLVTLLFLPNPTIASPPRNGEGSLAKGAVAEFFRKMVPNKIYEHQMTFDFINGWVFHLGLLIIVVGLAPHIMFFKRLIGISWPSLPSNLVLLVGMVTLASLLLALYHRQTSDVQKIISTFDDYFTWIVTVLPVVTGLLTTMHLLARYEILIGLHVLSICLFLVWFPFGKLMHAFLVFVTRGKTGAELARRGVNL